jgi:aspartate-semialdehyde dehydrogenase
MLARLCSRPDIQAGRLVWRRDPAALPLNPRPGRPMEPWPLREWGFWSFQEQVMGYRVAVVGATGAVGREMLKTLAERNFPVSEVIALASGRSAGQEVSFGEKTVLKVQNLEKFDFRGTDIGLFSPGASVSAVHAPRAAAAGCVVIDNTSQFRMEPDVPLVVPEVNPQHLKNFSKRNIIANPNCSTIQMVVALKPLHEIARIKRVVVSTYQSVSGAGKEAMDELFNQTRAMYVNDPARPEQFTKPIAFNCIPHIDKFMDDGFTKEEWKMAAETRKILDPDIAVIATCVRVPVFIAHSEAVHVEFEGPITESQAWDALRDAPGVQVIDKREDGGYITQLDAAGEDAVYVSRLRRDPTVPHGLAFWCVSDNLRKGAALNTVQIAEALVAQGLIAEKRAA